VPRLASRVVAVTGASSGIGRAVAEACAREGAAVAAFARRADRLEALAREIAAGDGRALAVAGDVTVEADVERLVAETVAAFGRLDVMVCNAGIGFHGTLDETPATAMRRLVDVNVLGTFYAARSALTVFRRQGRGHVIAVSSVSGRRGVGGSSVYSATKAAQVAFIEALRTELAGTGIHASVVLPVVTDTEFRDAIRRDYGHAVTGAGPRQTAERVASRIVDCMVSPRPEVYPYAAARWLSVLNVVAPATTDRVMRRFNRRRSPV
jgi:NADP-dependent 3-hydroxy acid dehydrogenase YdfG